MPVVQIVASKAQRCRRLTACIESAAGSFIVWSAAGHAAVNDDKRNICTASAAIIPYVDFDVEASGPSTPLLVNVATDHKHASVCCSFLIGYQLIAIARRDCIGRHRRGVRVLNLGSVAKAAVEVLREIRRLAGDRAVRSRCEGRSTLALAASEPG